MFMALHWAYSSRTNPLLHWTDTALQICLTRTRLRGRIPKLKAKLSLSCMCIQDHSSQVQGLTFSLVELHWVPVGQECPHCNHLSQFRVICNLAEDSLCPSAQVINEDIKLHWPYCLPLLQHNTTDWLPGGLVC